MELLQQPEIKSTYDKCKYKVKYWEHQFKKKNGRLPSKLDIREADRETRLAYKTYFNLKSAALEQSFQDIDGFNSDEETPSLSISTPDISSIDETKLNLSDSNVPENSTAIEAEVLNTDKTWGTHLNNQTEIMKKEKDLQKNVNTSFTQKLFKNSSFSKRNPRKSLSFVHRKSESNLNTSKSLSQPNPTVSEDSQSQSSNNFSLLDDSNSINYLNNESIKITTIMEPAQSKSLNVVQSVLESNFKSNRNIDAGWMQRVALTSGAGLKNNAINAQNFGLSQQMNAENNEDSDDIIGDSDEEMDKMHIAKRKKIEPTFSQQKTELFKPAINNGHTNCEPNIHAQNLPQINSENKLNFLNILNKPEEKQPTILKTNHSSNINTEVEPVKNKRKVTSKRGSKKVEETKPERKSTRARKKLTEIEPDQESDAFHNGEENDPDFNPTETMPETFNFIDEDVPEEKSKSTKKPAKKSAKPKKADEKTSRPKRSEVSRKSKKDEEPQEEAEDVPYELEYSIKPRIVSVPRNSDFKNVIKKAAKPRAKKVHAMKDDETGAIIKDKSLQEMDKMSKKLASGNLNENFVRINMKKKIYARGKKTMTFSKFKKGQWKQHKKNQTLTGPDMDMGGCDGGMLTCFKCGQIGHFAQQCKAERSDRLLPLTAAEEEYCPFPTLEEASEMAQGYMAIRKPKTITQEEETFLERDEPHESDSDNENFDERLPAEHLEIELDPFGDDEDDEALLAETLKLEEYVRKIDVQEYIDSPTSIKPYYTLNQDRSLIDTPDEVFEALKLFGHSSFRPGQEKAVMRILSGQSTLVTLSTGSGKSLCYQLPAYLYAKRQPCIALVISPLVSLMEDQVTGIPAFLKAACLHTNKTKVQRATILEQISEGNLDILLVSPEAVVAGEKSTGFGSLLRKLPPVAFACIDEAHCVSQWSHNFRPSYLMICRILKERLGINTILGLTATATRATGESIINHLSIPDGRAGIITDVPLPDNLRLTVSKDGNRDNALLGLLLSERFENLSSIIIYCIRRTECERIAASLRTSLKEEKPTETDSKKRKKLNVQAEPYHAGLSASRRRTIQKNFMSGSLRIVVATVAFGMGINKSDIRAVIHYNLPKNFESYVQEVGRAGRDGLPAHCHLFLDAQGRDESELQRHIFSDSLDRHVIRKLLQKIFIPCTCKLKCPKHEVAFSIQETVLALDLPEENISTLLCYLELHNERYIEVLSPAYTNCKIIAYGGGGNMIRKAAKDCPPLAMALVMFGDKDSDENVFEFPIVDVAAAIGWDSGICKHKLKNLEWISENNQPKRSQLSVQFANLGFRLLAPGNLTGVQLDETLDRLYQRVVDQERMALLQLHALHKTVISVCAPSYRTCISETISDQELQLKASIREYFESASPLDSVKLEPKKINEDVIVNDIRGAISMYRDNTFTGRAIARIFFGISSPNYPAVVWGRSKYWRAHISSDFNAICRLAQREILRMR